MTHYETDFNKLRSAANHLLVIGPLSPSVPFLSSPFPFPFPYPAGPFRSCHPPVDFPIAKEAVGKSIWRLQLLKSRECYMRAKENWLDVRNRVALELVLVI